MKISHSIMALSLIGGGSIFNVYAEAVQAQTNIQQITATTCAVMAGQKKPDRQSFQYLLLLDDNEAFGSANPVAIALYKGVLNQCPKAYLNFQHRQRVSNPFPPGSLVNPNPTRLYNSESSSSQENNRVDTTADDEAVRLHPNDIKVYIKRGNARYERKDYQGAIADYTEMIRLEPKNAKGYANRGLARGNLGDKQGAMSGDKPLRVYADFQVALTLFKAQGDSSSYQKVQAWLREIQ